MLNIMEEEGVLIFSCLQVRFGKPSQASSCIFKAALQLLHLEASAYNPPAHVVPGSSWTGPHLHVVRPACMCGRMHVHTYVAANLCMCVRE